MFFKQGFERTVKRLIAVAVALIVAGAAGLIYFLS